jgi:hypothetical protein
MEVSFSYWLQKSRRGWESFDEEDQFTSELATPNVVNSEVRVVISRGDHTVQKLTIPVNKNSFSMDEVHKTVDIYLNALGG